MTSQDDFLKSYLNGIKARYDASPYPRTHSSAETRSTSVTCFDGVKLTTEIYTPEGEGPWLTIVVRCPYPQQVPLWQLHGSELTQRGYALVCQWCRGTRTSEGIWEPDVNERPDGADLLEWLEAQDWVGPI